MIEEKSFQIIPEEPYNEFTSAYVFVSKEYQRRMIRFNFSRKRTFVTTYARYLFQVDYWKKHRKLIPEGYEVDHVNEDKLDDRIGNFQLLTKFENRQKNNFAAGSIWNILCCPICGKLFGFHAWEGTPQIVVTCSDKCFRSIQASTVTPELRLYLKRHQVKRKVRVYKRFPSGEEYLSSFIKELDECFYPNTLFNHQDWLPIELAKHLKPVDCEERNLKIKGLHDQGFSERKIADILHTTRKAVQVSLRKTSMQRALDNRVEE